MKKIKLSTVLTGSIAAAVAAGTIVPLAICGLNAKTNPSKPSIKYPTKKLNYSAAPCEIDMNSDDFPFAAKNTTSAEATAVITMPAKTNVKLQYQTNTGGEEWSTWTDVATGSATTVAVVANGYIRIRGINTTNPGEFTTTDSQIAIKLTTKSPTTDTGFELGGNIMSLLQKSEGECLTEFNSNSQWCFYQLFSGSTINSVSEYLLPSMYAAPHCYEEMFASCAYLAKAPALPATTLYTDCYKNMFKGCEKLEVAPNLPAINLVSGCYEGMFDGCSALKSISLAYTGSFISGYFKNWVNNVNLAGTIYYNGSDTLNKSVHEIPVNYSVYQDPNFKKNKESWGYKEIELKADSTSAKFGSNRTKLTWYCPSDSTDTLATVFNDPSGNNQLDLKPVSEKDNEIAYYDATAAEPTAIPASTKLCDLKTNTIKFSYSFDPIINDKYVNIYSGTSDFTINITKAKSFNLEMSTDAGQSWSTVSDTKLSLKARTNYVFRGNIGSTGTTDYTNFKITSGSNVHIQGNLMSLIQQDGATPTTITQKYAFYKLFEGSTKIVDISANALPSTTLAEGCYANMFKGCTNLKNAPTLPATNLANSCYLYMFANCSSLENSIDSTDEIELKATTVPQYAYSHMFEGCTKIEKTPIFAGVKERPATGTALQEKMSIKTHSCEYMFKGCSKLTEARPLALGSIEDADYCCQHMFADCTSLVIAPCISHHHSSDLGAETPVQSFANMFSGCSKLCAFKEEHSKTDWATSDSLSDVYPAVQKKTGYFFCTDDRSNKGSSDDTWGNMLSGCTQAIAEGCPASPLGYTETKFPTWNSVHLIQSFYSYHRNPTSITLSDSTLSLVAGKTQQLTVTSVAPYAAYDTVTWSSSNTSVASVNSNGYVIANNAGTATITATSTVASGVKATCTVTVTEPTEPIISTIEAKYTGTTTIGSVLTTGNLEVVATLESGATKTLTGTEYTVEAMAPGTSEWIDVTAQVRDKGYTMSTEGEYNIVIKTTQNPEVSYKFPIEIGEAKEYITIDEDTGLVSLTEEGKALKGELSVPEKINNITVTGIAARGFAEAQCSSIKFAVEANINTLSYYSLANCVNLTAFEVPANVKNVEYATFGGCTALKDLTFATGSKLLHIFSDAFADCEALEQITFPSTVETIASEAFVECDNLKSVLFASTSGDWYQMGGKSITLSSTGSVNAGHFLDFTTGGATGENWGATGIEIKGIRTISSFNKDALSEFQLEITEGLPETMTDEDGTSLTITVQNNDSVDHIGTLIFKGKTVGGVYTTHIAVKHGSEEESIHVDLYDIFVNMAISGSDEVIITFEEEK